MTFAENISAGFLLVFKYLPPLMLMVVICLSIYSHFFPWVPAKETLDKYKGHIVVVYNYNSSTTLSSDRNLLNKQQEKSYLVINPKSLSSKTVKVVVDLNGKNVLENDGGLIPFILICIVFLIMIWKFWFQKEHT